MRQLRDNEIVIALIAGIHNALQHSLPTSQRSTTPGTDGIVWAEKIIAEVIRRGDAAESQ